MQARFLWRAYRARLQDQAAELDWMRRRINRGDLVCDVGANKGSYLYWMSRWSRRVVAFEPQPQLATYLQAAVASSALSNVTVEQSAIANRSGVIELFVPSPASPEASLIPSQGVPSISVPVTTLDDYFSDAERLAFIKIDVEGAELDVFRGAERVLRLHRPCLLFESEQRHLQSGSVLDCFQHLLARGYQGWFIDGRELRPVGSFDPSVHQKQAGERFWRSPHYCNNFLFEPV